MTTICTDGVTLAGDRMISAGGTAQTAMTKVHHLKDGSVAGLSGDAVQFEPMLDYLNGEGDPPDGDVNALVLKVDGSIRKFENGQSLPYAGPAAIGSGTDLALGALLAGASPEEAVRIACERDCYSGMGFDCLSPIKTRRVRKRT